MRLSRFPKTKWFAAGTAAGFLLFVIANTRSYYLDGCSEEGRCGFGFPIEWYYASVFDTADGRMQIERGIVWGGLFADLFVALLASVLLGALCYKLYQRRPTYK